MGPRSQGSGWFSMAPAVSRIARKSVQEFARQRFEKRFWDLRLVFGRSDGALGLLLIRQGRISARGLPLHNLFFHQLGDIVQDRNYPRLRGRAVLPPCRGSAGLFRG